ncbi:MAG TPA: peptide MFS transporter, partial [Magnetospirillaceae bacterium]|nr:peptide MFS transporter [Magnetospirillaceae bacterium]
MTSAIGRWRGHPPGLLVLAGIEFWERFAYYGLLANLVFYLTWHLDLDRDIALRQMAAFTALVFLCPLAGGLIADRWLGARPLVACGLLMLLAGHGLMVFSPHQTTETLVLADGTRQPITRPLIYPATGEESVRPAVSGRIEKQEDHSGRLRFHLALALVAAGIGFMKANISALVGTLYKEGVALRDQGFTLFYMAINAGGFIGSATCGWLAFRFGWEPGFGAAGLGMIAALALLRFGGRWLPPERSARRPHTPLLAGAAGIGLALLCWGLLGAPPLVERLLDLAALSGAGFVLYRSRGLGTQQRFDLLLLALLMMASVLFWTLQGQSPAALSLFTAEWVDLHLLGIEIPAPVLQFTPMAAIMLLAAPIGALWRRLERWGILPSPLALSALGILQMGLSFLVLTLGVGLTPAGGKTALLWLGLCYVLQASGELFLSPIGLSTITRLSPPGLSGTMLGLWFLSTAYAQKLSVLVGSAT